MRLQLDERLAYHFQRYPGKEMSLGCCKVYQMAEEFFIQTMVWYTNKESSTLPEYLSQFLKLHKMIDLLSLFNDIIPKENFYRKWASVMR